MTKSQLILIYDLVVFGVHHNKGERDIENLMKIKKSW